MAENSAIEWCDGCKAEYPILVMWDDGFMVHSHRATKCRYYRAPGKRAKHPPCRLPVYKSEAGAIRSWELATGQNWEARRG